MRINIFEGARRIAMLAGVIWIIGWLVAGFKLREPNVYVTLTIAFPGSPFILSDRMTCDAPNAFETTSRKTGLGTKANVILCFLAQKDVTGTLVIPYKVDLKNKNWWGGSRDLPEVAAYIAETRDQFTLSIADQTNIEKEYWSELLKGWGVYALIAGTGLALLFATTWAVGWIVRGFLGVPRGHDCKPQNLA